MSRFYNLKKLPYEYDYLEPILSSEQIHLHQDKHHKAYVEKANEILEKLDKEKGNAVPDLTCTYKKLTFNVGGIILHDLYFDSMRNPNGGEPEGELAKKLEEEFGSFDGFKKQFLAVATTIEGSGWAALFYCKMTDRLLIAPIQNHNLNIYPMFKIILVLDMWEHAYYVDYKNDKKKYAEGFWQIVDWDKVGERFFKIKV